MAVPGVRSKWGPVQSPCDLTTRLVHIWSAPIWFLFRPGYQIVRSRGPLTGKRTRDIHLAAPEFADTTVSRQKAESGQGGA